MIAIVKKKKVITIAKKKVVNIKKDEDNDGKKRKQSHTKYSLLIAIHLWQANYQILLITCHESLMKNAQNAWEEKKLGRNRNLLDLKIIDWIIDAKNPINHVLSCQMKQLKIFRIYIDFAMVILIIFVVVRKRCLRIWIYGWLVKIWWNINTA